MNAASRHNVPALPRKGLSMVEIVVVATVLAVISITVAAYAFDAGEREQVQNTRLKLADLSKKIDHYSRDAGELPADLAPLTLGSDRGPWLEPRDLLDAWGNEVLYTRTTDSEFELVSAGPDETDGTTDDIRMTF